MDDEMDEMVISEGVEKRSVCWHFDESVAALLRQRERAATKHPPIVFRAVASDAPHTHTHKRRATTIFNTNPLPSPFRLRLFSLSAL